MGCRPATIQSLTDEPEVTKADHEPENQEASGGDLGHQGAHKHSPWDRPQRVV
jgi:hypothetical protein